MGAFSKIISRLRITSDPNVTTQTSAVIQADSGNTNLVISPSGTGALVAQAPDGTVAGGNARGDNAVDLQTARSAADQVARRPYSGILSGRNNGIFQNAGNYSVISGGNTNSIIFGDGNTISGGQSNIINSTGFTSYNAIVGGYSNVANGGGIVVGGENNTGGGLGSTVFGRLNTSGGQYNSIFGYAQNLSGNHSFAAGVNNISGASNTAMISYHGYAYLLGQFVQGTQWAGGTYEGTFQSSVVLATSNPTLTSGATATLSLDGSGTTNLIIPRQGAVVRSWNVTIKYTAVVTAITGTATGVSVGDTKTQNIEIGFKRVGVTSSLVGAGSYSIAQEDASMNSATLVPTAGGSQQLALTFTAPTFAGGGSLTLKIIAKVELVEAAH